MRFIRALAPALLLLAGSAGCDAPGGSEQASQAAKAAPADPSTASLPKRTGRVVDLAGLLDPATEAELTARSAALERKTSDQLVIVTIPDLHGQKIEAFGLALGRAWGVGQKTLNNGVLLIVAPKERQVRIEVGYGLEGLLTDQRASRIIETDMIPRLKQVDYADAAKAGAGSIIATLVSDTKRPKPRTAKVRR